MPFKHFPIQDVKTKRSVNKEKKKLQTATLGSPLSPVSHQGGTAVITVF